MKCIIPIVFSLLGGCLPITVITGVVGVSDSYLKEVRINKLDNKIKHLEKNEKKSGKKTNRLYVANQTKLN